MAKKASEKQARMAQERKNQRQQEIRAARKKKKRRKVIRNVIICVIIVAIIAGASTFCAIARPLTHLFPALKTEHYSLNAAEISFFSWQIYQEYADTAESIGMDTSIPLSEQNFSDDQTWEDYFVEAGREYAETLLVYYNAAVENGADINEDDYADDAQEIYDYYSDIADTLPSYVSEKDAIHALEIYLIASDEYDRLYDSIEVSDEEMEEYYEEDPTTMQVCSYITFSFMYDTDEEIYYVSSDEAAEYASQLRRCNTLDSFEDWVVDYYLNNTSGYSEAQVRSTVESFYAKDITYTEGDDVSEWAFALSTNEGDTTVFDDGSGTMTVALLVEEPKRDESYPVTIRHILFSTDSYDTVEQAAVALDNLYAEWEGEGGTEELFAEYADAYSEDTAVSGGLYENIELGQLLTSWKEWLTDPARKEGDTTILQSTDSASLVYYVSQDDTMSWEYTAKSAVAENKYQNMYDEYYELSNVSPSNFAMRFAKVLND